MKGRKIFERKRSTSNRNNCNLETVVKQSQFKNMKDYNKEQTTDGVNASRPDRHLIWTKDKIRSSVEAHFMKPTEENNSVLTLCLLHTIQFYINIPHDH